MTGFDDSEVVMNFLPFTHIFERAWTYYCVSKGCLLCINLRPQDIQKTIKGGTAYCHVQCPAVLGEGIQRGTGENQRDYRTEKESDD